ncbi:hypothetical protein ACRALDRAFT_1090678 [Sodiomyces alcalophilus JCM 7366]|uniref:uncharacterized protein n=1 Tax=Sodiomyces alcalophilus JCM 7366 TaxID=591952 RepID=UPI0039B4679F
MNGPPNDSQGFPSPLPESQWSRRFNIPTQVPSVGRGLCWMDPQYPSLDVDTLQPTNAPGPGEKFPCPDPQDLDSLFLSEQLQSSTYALRTWEAAVLTSMNPYMEPTNEHTLGRDLDLEPKRSCTIIDESEWMGVFQKDRWNLDFRNPEVGVRWSVDEPHIWHAMRPSIDLANRIVRAACHHKWMATFVNPSHVSALENVELPLGNAQGNRGTIWKMLDMDPRCVLSPADTFNMLNQLLETTRFGFYDQYNTQEPTHVVDAYTFPTPYPLTSDASLQVEARQSQIIVSVELIQPLIDDSLPAHIRRTTQVVLGITLAHELMHAVFLEQLRRHKRLQFQPYPVPSWYYETVRLRSPTFLCGFDYNENVHELGESFEKILFGHRFNEAGRPHSSSWVGPRYRNRVLFLLGAMNWPTRDLFERSYGIHQHQLAEAERAPVPAIYHFWLMSMPFWHNVVAKYGLEALRIPRMLHSTYDEGYSVAGWDQDPGVGASPLAPPLKRLARMLHKTRLQWHEWRDPWYKDTLARWQLTPYSDGRKRIQLDFIINTLMTGRTRMDERLIVTICNDWMQPYHWPSCRLLRNTGKDRAVEDYRRTDWFYRALAMLLGAALPTHPEPFKAFIAPNYPDGIPWTMRTGPHFFSLDELQARQSAVIDCMNMRGSAGDEIELYHPSYGFEQYLPMGLKEYRSRLVQIAKSYWRIYEVHMTVVPRGLKTAFFNTCEHLQQQINLYAVVDAANNLATDSWLDFNFRFPPYGDLGGDRVFGIDEASELEAEAETDMYGQVILEPDNVGDLPAWALAGTVSSSGSPQDEPLDLLSMRQLSIADVYDYGQSAGRPMVLIDRINWVGVYDWQQVARCLGLDATVPWALTTRTQEGRYLRLADTHKFLAMDAALRPKPVGRLIRVVREEDPTLWTQTTKYSFVTMLGYVYNITGFRFGESTQLERNLSRIMRKNAGGNPQEDLRKANIDVADVIEMLQPSRVAAVQQRVTPVRNDQVFTKNEVRCHRYRRANTGMYIIIRNKVYDIKDYCKFHPGGIDHLQDFGGRDATKPFEEMHQDPEGLLERMDYLRIGRIVEEYDPSEPVPSGCVRLHNYTYSIRSLLKDEATRGLGERLLPYDGKTLNPEPKRTHVRGDVEHQLATMLVQRRDAIVGKASMFAERVIPDITVDELAEYYFELDVVQKMYRQAFVAVGNEKNEWLVYDVTGGIVEDGQTGAWVKKTFDVYTVARLVESKGKGKGKKGKKKATKIDWNPIRVLTGRLSFVQPSKRKLTKP